MSKKLTVQQKARKMWVKALRSGKFQQGYGKLHYENKDGEQKFCCLGVLCELAVKEGVISPSEKYNRDYEYDGADATLPEAVLDWVGIKDDCGSMKKGSLVSRNDSRKYSFERIADIIESKSSELFKEEVND